MPSKISIWDVVEATGLVSATGQKLNGSYGKVADYCLERDRYTVRFKGQKQPCLLKLDNLVLTMKHAELSDSDEDFFSSLPKS